MFRGMRVTHTERFTPLEVYLSRDVNHWLTSGLFVQRRNGHAPVSERTIDQNPCQPLVDTRNPHMSRCSVSGSERILAEMSNRTWAICNFVRHPTLKGPPREEPRRTVQYSTVQYCTCGRHFFLTSRNGRERPGPGCGPGRCGVYHWLTPGRSRGRQGNCSGMPNS